MSLRTTSPTSTTSSTLPASGLRSTSLTRSLSPLYLFFPLHTFLLDPTSYGSPLCLAKSPLLTPPTPSLPGPDPVRLREAAAARPAHAEAKERRTPRPPLHPDDGNARHLRELPHLPRPHLPQTGRCFSPTSRLHALLLSFPPLLPPSFLSDLPLTQKARPEWTSASS